MKYETMITNCNIYFMILIISLLVRSVVPPATASSLALNPARCAATIPLTPLSRRVPPAPTSPGAVPPATAAPLTPSNYPSLTPPPWNHPTPPTPAGRATRRGMLHNFAETSLRRKNFPPPLTWENFPSPLPITSLPPTMTRHLRNLNSTLIPQAPEKVGRDPGARRMWERRMG